MFRILGYYSLLVISGSSLALKECSQLGIFRSKDSTKFLVCTEKDGEVIGAELACSKDTIYSGKDAKCVPKVDENVINTYDLFQLGGIAGNTEVSLNCITPGVICSKCDTMTFCIGETALNGTTTVRVIQNVKCDADEHCAVGIGCTKNREQPCSLAPFVCDDLGVFPDPYDCKKYHFCSKNVSLEYTCSTGSFNSQTATCGYSLSREVCLQRPVPFCKKLWQVGPLPTDASFHYICVKYESVYGLRPSLHKCPANLHFNPTTLSCS